MASITDSSHRPDLGPRIDPGQLAYALAIRGKDRGDLRTARGGPLSVNTVTKLFRRPEPVTLRGSTLRALAAWLQETPVDPHLAAVIARPAQESTP